MIETFLRDLRQPEYIHLLINPLPIYGLVMGWIGLVIALFLKSRRAQIATLAIVFLSAISAWPVYELGQQAYDRVLSMTDEDGERWLDEHQDRAEDLIWVFYALAVLSASRTRSPGEPPGGRYGHFGERPRRRTGRGHSAGIPVPGRLIRRPHSERKEVIT